MSTPSSTPSRRPSPGPRPGPNPPRPERRAPLARRIAAALGVLAVAACAATAPVQAQQVVFDPRNHVENALQAARQAQSLTNEARMLLNQARAIAASPYSHLGETGQALGDLVALAQAARGVAGDVAALERQFESLYPTAVEGLAPDRALAQAAARTANAGETARDLARTAAELERLARSRNGRLSGAVAASEQAQGQTAAIQSSTQVLAVLAEELGSIRTALTAQSRLMAEVSARQAAERAAAAEARRGFWGRATTAPPAPAFDPFARARN